MKFDFQSSRRDLLKFFAAAAPAAIAAGSALESIPENPAGSLVIPTEEEIAWLNREYTPQPVPTRGTWLEVLPWLYYDRISIPPGRWPQGSMFHFFAYPIGTCDPNLIDPIHQGTRVPIKQVAHTNSVRGNQLPPPTSFMIEWVYSLTSPFSQPEDMATFHDAAVLEFRRDDKIHLSAPLLRFPIVGEPENVLARHQPTNRIPGAKAVTPKLAHRTHIEILPLQQFSATMFLGRDIQIERPIHITLVLDGMISRSVQ